MKDGSSNHADALMYYSGTSGLQVPFPKYQFPLEHASSSRLTFYSTLFNSIEINSSFYKLPLARTLMKWSNEVPDRFKFTFKLWKEITHAKNLEFRETDVENFIAAINHVGAKKGSLLIQFPPSLTVRCIEPLLHLLRTIQHADPQSEWPVALEFRDSSWYNEEIYKLVDSLRASVVIHDKKGLSSPSLKSDAFVYLRFHGPSGDYRECYTDEFLAEYAEYIKTWLSENKRVSVYFNNTVGQALQNLTTLNKYVSER